MQRAWRLRQSASGLAVASLLLIGGIAAGSGCAEQTRVVRRSETVRHVEPLPPPTTERVVTEQTTTTTKAAGRGILSTAVHVIGEVIALPFRLLGGVIRLVF